MIRHPLKFVGSLCMIALVAWPASAWAQSPVSPQRPALYEFGSKICAACIQMQKVIADLKASHGDKVEFRMVYVDQERDLFQQYRIMLIPTQVFLDASGKEVDRHVGALTREEVLKKLKELNLLK